MAIPQRRQTPPWPFVAMVGMAATFFLYAASVAVAPWWAVLLLAVCWLAFFVTACRWWSPHPVRILLVPLASVVLWFAVVVAGSVWLDWTA